MAAREGNAKRPIYEVHKWWARRLGANFRMLLLASLMPARTHDGTLWKEFYGGHPRSRVRVLDPFVGGGTSVIEAIKLGVDAAGIDIDPVAWFVTKKEVEPCDLALLRREADRIVDVVANKVQTYYTTKALDGSKRQVINFFWVDLIACPKCHHQTEGHPNYLLGSSYNRKTTFAFCRSCHEVAAIPRATTEFICKSCGNRTVVAGGVVKEGTFSCPECAEETELLALASEGNPSRKVLFAVEYEGNRPRERLYKKADSFDLDTFEAAQKAFEQERESLPFPRDLIPTNGRSDSRPVSYGYKYYHQLFNERQLYSLSLILREVTQVGNQDLKEYLLLAFSDSLASNNMLCSYAFGYRKLTPLFGLHAYRMVTRPVEGNVLGSGLGRGSFPKCVQKLVTGKMFCKNPYEYFYTRRGARPVYTGESIEVTVTEETQGWLGGEARCLLLNRPAERLDGFGDQSVDLILTDPPYYDNLPYSELSDFYFVWLRQALKGTSARWSAPSTPIQGSLFVSAHTSEQHANYVSGLTQVFHACRRVIKPAGLMVFTYHHRRPAAWLALYSALHESGWRVTNVFPILSEGKSGFHSSEGSLKWDVVFCCRPTQAHHAQHLRPNQVRRWAERRALKWQDRLRMRRMKLPKEDVGSLAAGFLIMRLLQLGVPYAQGSPFLERLLTRGRRVSYLSKSPTPPDAKPEAKVPLVGWEGRDA